MNDPAVATLAAKYFSSESAEEIEVLDPFNMFGCGPSMDKKWIAIVKSDPKRTVAIFDIPLGSSAKSGVHIGTSNHEKGDTRAVSYNPQSPFYLLFHAPSINNQYIISSSGHMSCYPRHRQLCRAVD